MFPDRTDATPFHNTAADNYFTKIGYTVDVNSYPAVVDHSFLSTLRAFVYPRMGDDDRLLLQVYEGYTMNQVRAYFDDSLLRENTLTILSVRDMSDVEDAEKHGKLTIFDEEHLFAWQKAEKVTAFFRKAFAVSCYINSDIRSTVLFVNRMDLRRFHYLQCGILAYLPWYFDKDAGISEDDRELIESLRDKSPARYMRILEKMAKPFDFRALSIKEGLSDFETLFERKRLEVLQQNIDDIRRRMELLMLQYSESLKEKQEKDIMLMGLTMKIEENHESEIMEYFLRHKNLHFAKLYKEDGYMDFAVTGYSINYDMDLAEKMVENDRSVFYSGHGGLSRGDRKLLLREIFLEQNLRLRFCAAYRIYINRSNIDGIGGYDYCGNLGITDCLPNPHIDAYQCLGEYKRQMMEALKNQDYIGAIELSIASCNSLNFADGAVMNRFVDMLLGDYGATRKCIELPDGKVVTGYEAVQYLKGDGTDENKEGDDE